MYDTGHTVLLERYWQKGRRTQMKHIIRMINLFEYYKLPFHVRPVVL